MEQVKNTFFSIVVPAHNEENYIEDTLRYLQALDYPKDSYEVIVIENGSTDATYARASALADGNVRVLSFAERGVAFARNRGIEAARPDGDWLIFLDADSYFEPQVLRELADFLADDAQQGCVIGTTAVCPMPSSVKGRMWFLFYDGVHELLRQSFASIIVRRDALDGHLFNESFEVQEDVRFVQRLMKKRRFFFFHTRGVFTSTRRFEQEGWLRLFLFHALVGSVPPSLQAYFKYAQVR